MAFQSLRKEILELTQNLILEDNQELKELFN